MNNQECKVRPETININSNEPHLILLVLKYVHVLVIVITSMIHMQNYVFLILVKA